MTPLRSLLLFALMSFGLAVAVVAAAGPANPGHFAPCVGFDQEEVNDMAPRTIVTSDYSNLSSGPIRGRLGRESAKTGERGRARMTVTIEAEPLVHRFDEVQLGKGPAQAIADELREKVSNISEPVSDRTAETRKHQEAAYHRGEPWAVSRFGYRGQMGPAHFKGDGRKFNHSGTFAGSIVATENKTERSWTVNVSANRLDPRTSRHSGDFAHITDTLRRLVPELDNPSALANSPRVKHAIDVSIEQLVINAGRLNSQLKSQIGWAVLNPILNQLGLGGVRRGVQTLTFG